MKKSKSYPRIRTRLAPVLLLFLNVLSGHAEARNFDPFSTSDDNPMSLLFGLPPAQNVVGPGKGQFSLQLIQDISNHFVTDTSLNEGISLDGESWQSTLVARLGLSKKIDLGLQLGHLTHKGGELDHFIEEWHDFVRISNASRDRVDRDQIQYFYFRNGLTRYLFSEKESGRTDTLMYLTYQLPHKEKTTDSKSAIRVGIKIPTGKLELLTGSGEKDYFAEVMMQGSINMRDSLFTWNLGAGVLKTGVSDWAQDFQKDNVFFGHAGIAWHASRKLAFKLQLDAHTPFYKSELKPLGENFVQIVMGGHLQIGNNYTLHIGVTEDIAPGTGPDVGFHLSLSRQFE